MRKRYDRLFDIISVLDKEPSTIKTLDDASRQIIEIIKFLIENEMIEEVDILSKAEVIMAEKSNGDKG